MIYIYCTSIYNVCIVFVFTVYILYLYFYSVLYIRCVCVCMYTIGLRTFMIVFNIDIFHQKLLSSSKHSILILNLSIDHCIFVSTECKMEASTSQRTYAQDIVHAAAPHPTAPHTTAPHISLCGVCCVGKSSILNSLRENDKFHVIMSDFLENTQRLPLFRKKHTNLGIQCLYSIYMRDSYTVDRTVDPGHANLFLHDRDFKSDLFYDAVMKEMENRGTGLQMLETIFGEPFFFKTLNVPTIFMILAPEVEPLVLKQMRKRNNGLDLMSLDYVSAQNRVFTYMQKFSPTFNYHFIQLEKDKIYTHQVYEMVKEKIRTIAIEWVD